MPCPQENRRTASGRASHNPRYQLFAGCTVGQNRRMMVMMVLSENWLDAS
jgi:hypothetical protein